MMAAEGANRFPPHPDLPPRRWAFSDAEPQPSPETHQCSRAQNQASTQHTGARAGRHQTDWLCGALRYIYDVYIYTHAHHTVLFGVTATPRSALPEPTRAGPAPVPLTGRPQAQNGVSTVTSRRLNGFKKPSPHSTQL